MDRKENAHAKIMLKTRTKYSNHFSLSLTKKKQISCLNDKLLPSMVFNALLKTGTYTFPLFLDNRNSNRIFDTCHN